MRPTRCIAEWLVEVDNIALSSTVAAPDFEAAHLRAMGVLMRLRPLGMEDTGMEAGREAEVTRNLNAGAFESAALRLLPDNACLMTSTPGPGRHLATVQLAGQQRESTSSGSTFALALVGALALSIVDRYHETAGLLPS